jgi:ParB family chromosome partitioning protein
LLRLPSAVQQLISAGTLSFGHAKVLLALDRQEDILIAAKRIQSLAMSVRQSEVMVQGMLQPEAQRKAKLKEPLDPNVREARDELQRALGLKVIIEDRHGKGRVIIEYAHLEDFDSLMDAIVRD